MSLKTMMFSKIKEINYKKLDKLASDIAKRNNKTKLYVKFDMFKNFIIYGIGYTDYLKGDYINLTKKQKKTFLTTKSYYNFINYLNDRKYISIMSNKILFNKVFKDYIKREFIDIRISSFKEFVNFFKDKKTIFAKPIDDFGGHRIKKIVFDDVKDLKLLYNELRNSKLYLIEESIKQHPELDKLNPYAVNSFRIVTLVKDNKSYIVGNALRINLNKEVAIGCEDAYMRIGIDGKIISRVVDDVANVYKEHPITKIKFDKVIIPYVKEAYDMVLKAALEVREVRYVGWDVAITNNGPVIIEGNENPSYGLIQYYLFNDEHVGHLLKISNILKDEMKNIKL